VTSYSQARAVDDIFDVVNATGVDRGHIVGLSMGGFAALHAGLRHPDRVFSVCAAGAGYGAEKAFEDYFRGISEQVATNFETQGASHENGSPTFQRASAGVRMPGARRYRSWGIQAHEHRVLSSRTTVAEATQLRRSSR
jgi:pimeloyl-ACP methyl ester carboxylesterase